MSPVKNVMPKAGKTSYFKNYNKKTEHPYIIYMDFESALYKIDTCTSDPDKEYTIKTHLHKPYGLTIYLVPRVNYEVYKPLCYRAESEEDLEKVPEKLLKELPGISKFIAHKLCRCLHNAAIEGKKKKSVFQL